MAGPKTKGFEWRGWMSVAVLVPAVALTLCSHPPVEASSVADGVLDIIGWALCLCGIIWRLWAALYIGGRKSRVLVQDGPYSICRNPLYVGTLLLGLSVAVMLESLIVLAAVVVMFVIYVTYTIPAEERHLASLFGEEYEQYKQRTPRLIPRPRLFSTRPVLEIPAAGLPKVFKLLALWFAMPIASELVEHLRSQPWWPAIFRPFLLGGHA